MTVSNECCEFLPIPGPIGCCPQPLPLCPFGGRALQPCVHAGDCPIGFGCTPSGGCCHHLTASADYIAHSMPSCPLNQLPVCQCSAGICPLGSNCNAGICCTPSAQLICFYFANFVLSSMPIYRRCGRLLLFARNALSPLNRLSRCQRRFCSLFAQHLHLHEWGVLEWRFLCPTK